MPPFVNFMAHRRLAVSLSLLLVICSILAIGIRGLNFGLDFTGGTLVELRFADPVTPDGVRATLVGSGFPLAVVQSLGSERDILIRIPPQPGASDQQSAEDLLASLGRHYPDLELKRAEFVGPTVGEDLRDAGLLALLAAFAGIALYVGWRFTGKFATAALVALVHDVLITVGFFAVFQWHVDLSTVAALLTVIGYSLNDTIVICDRIRENMRRLRRHELLEVIDISLNQTLERTLVMSGTTLLVLVVMAVGAGDQLRGFAVALTIGVVVGTYSSIYVAAAYLLHSRLSREDLLLPEAETQGAATEEGPGP